MKPLIKLTTEQRLTMALLALAHKYGKVEYEDDGDSLPTLGLDIEIPPEIVYMCLKHQPHIGGDATCVKISTVKYSEDITTPEANPLLDFQLVKWEHLGVSQDGRDQWSDPKPQDEKTRMTQWQAFSLNRFLGYFTGPNEHKRWMLVEALERGEI